MAVSKKKKKKSYFGIVSILESDVNTMFGICSLFCIF